MGPWKLPPRIKVLEALGAIADGRVKLEDGKAKVTGSDGKREYEVKFDLKEKKIDSNDNGSVFKGYLGYPSIAVLMLKKVLPFDEEISKALKGIRWRELNEKYKSYFKTEFVAKRIAERRGVKPEKIDEFVEKVLEEIRRWGFKRYT